MADKTDRKKGAPQAPLLETLDGSSNTLRPPRSFLGYQLRRAPLDPGGHAISPARTCRIRMWASILRSRKDRTISGPLVPVGHITPKQMLRVAGNRRPLRLRRSHLTVAWQNFHHSECAGCLCGDHCKALRKIGFRHAAIHLRSGPDCLHRQFCCHSRRPIPGARTRSSSRTNLDKRIKLEEPVNIHLTGCPNSCAQHYAMGDGRCSWMKAKVGGVEGGRRYHVFVGGGFGASQAVGRPGLQRHRFRKAFRRLMEKMLRGYLRHRTKEES